MKCQEFGLCSLILTWMLKTKIMERYRLSMVRLCHMTLSTTRNGCGTMLEQMRETVAMTGTAKLTNPKFVREEESRYDQNSGASVGCPSDIRGPPNMGIPLNNMGDSPNMGMHPPSNTMWNGMQQLPKATQGVHRR